MIGAKPPTAAERALHDEIRDIGCIIAMERGLGKIPCEIHHLTIGNRHGQKRRGQSAVVGLNQWSHRGILLPGWSEARCRAQLGPSYAKEAAFFRERYPDDYLEQLQASALESHRKMTSIYASLQKGR